VGDYVMTIDGQAVPAEQTFGVINPATGEVFAQAPECTREQLDAAMESAHKAQLSWKQDAAARTAALLRAADAVDAAAQDLGPLLTAEQGKPVAQAIGEAKGVAAWLRYFANIDLPREVIQDDERVFAEVVRRPIGVVAAITPWNFPLSMAAWKFAPALSAGNTVVVKPSPYTPLATLRLGEILRDTLPPGVLNIVSGSDQLGSWMTSHPLVRKISFTGSVATGKKVAAAAAPDLKRVTLELGGNDPAIVLDDVDIEDVAARLFWSAFRNSGQVCIAVKRVYVPERLHDDLVDALAAKARAAKVDDGMAEGTDLGPINNKPQFERVSELVSDALSNGATAVAGGGPLDRPGYFFAPTVLTGVSDGTRIVDEEQFGPALPVIPYRDVDDALARANATMFGLGGSVWSADPDRAADVAERLETGTAWVNTHAALSPQQPFGGAKWSGIGVENGSWGLLGYTEIQVVHRSKK
jgi:acyl-CoA reductase-like NAD-dependent aldehyde dehydrogenase